LHEGWCALERYLQTKISDLKEPAHV